MAYAAGPQDRGEAGDGRPPPDADPFATAAMGRAAAPAGTTAAGVAYGAGRPAPIGPDDDYDDAYIDDVYDDDLGTDDDGDGDRGGRPRRRRRLLVALLVVMAMIAAALFVAWTWVQGKIDPSGGPGEAVTIEIPEGSSTADIGELLAGSGVISDSTVWNWYTRVNYVGSIQAGRYELRQNLSFAEAIDVLEAGAEAPPGLSVTVPEGYTLEQITQRVSDPEEGVPGFEAAAVQEAIDTGVARSRFVPADQASAEGTLFPETYRLEEGDAEAALVEQMIGQFDAVMTELRAEERAAALGYSPYEVLIVASMVEREARVDGDRAQIARVIYNRLAQDTPLGIDAVNCYVEDEDPCQLTAADLESDSPYNVRETVGLPPTPIASPGRESLEAALAPAEGPWMYYALADEEGHHEFNVSYEDHLAAVDRCQERGLGCG